MSSGVPKSMLVVVAVEMVTLPEPSTLTAVLPSRSRTGIGGSWMREKAGEAGRAPRDGERSGARPGRSGVRGECRVGGGVLLHGVHPGPGAVLHLPVIHPAVRVHQQ